MKSTPHPRAAGYANCSDEELMAFISARDDVAFDELYNRYSRRLLYFFLRMNGNNREEANDLLQETFLRVFDKSGQYDASKKLSPWLFTIAGNLFRNLQRQAGRASAHLRTLSEAEKSAPAATEKIDQRSFRASLDKALANLDETQRMVFVLRFMEELPVAEIAVIMDCPEGTVKSRIHHTLRKLSEELHEFSPHFIPVDTHEQR